MFDDEIEAYLLQVRCRVPIPDRDSVQRCHEQAPYAQQLPSLPVCSRQQLADIVDIDMMDEQVLAEPLKVICVVVAKTARRASCAVDHCK